RTVTLIVNTEADTTPGQPPLGSTLSLRQAIEAADNGGDAVINFSANVQGKTISPAVPLPPLTADAITIDGCSSSVCPGAVTIAGSATPSTAPADGIQICSSNDVIRGLKIVNFGRAGVAIDPECTPVSFSVANRVELNDLENNHFAGVLVKNPAQVG